MRCGVDIGPLPCQKGCLFRSSSGLQKRGCDAAGDSEESEPELAGAEVEDEGARKRARVEKSHIGMASQEAADLQGMSVAEQEALALKLLSGR